MAVIGLAILVWTLYRFSGTDSTDISTGCIKVNRNKFKVRWDSEKIPAGVVTRAAKKYLGSEESLDASIVGGFFRGIDVYPSDSAAKYYSKQIQDFANSSAGLPWWSMATGELSCKI